MTIGKVIKLEDAPHGDRLIVCGGRDYVDRERVFMVLDELEPKEIAHGGATGADTLALEWAKARNVPYKTYRALWQSEGRSAGPKRNRRMFASFAPDGTVAFTGGDGTEDMENVTIDGGAYLVRVR